MMMLSEIRHLPPAQQAAILRRQSEIHLELAMDYDVMARSLADDDWMTENLPETSGDKGLGEGNGLKSGVDY